jgi:actin related protein 2/3 complex subunit 1A/1B
VHFADLTTMQPGAEPVVHTVRLPQLPLCSLLFLSEKALCGAGHDFNPVIFTGNSGTRNASPVL